MELKATIIQVLPVERGVSQAGKEWEKATVIAEYGDEKYPKRVAISAFKNADKFAEIPVGAEVMFNIDIESREFNSRWYTSVSCWKWDILGGVESAAPTPPPAAPQTDDGLPF